MCSYNVILHISNVDKSKRTQGGGSKGDRQGSGIKVFIFYSKENNRKKSETKKNQGRIVQACDVEIKRFILEAAGKGFDECFWGAKSKSRDFCSSSL